MKDLTLQKTAEYLLEKDRYLILTHKRPDGDAHGSAAGLAMVLRNAGKTAYVLPNPETTAKFLPYIQEFWAPEGYQPETIVSVDLASEDLFPENAGPYRGRVQLSIDHHPSNTGYSCYRCLNGGYSSCGEIIFDLMKQLCQVPDKKLAEALYIALATDTGCFSYSNTTDYSFHVAGELASSGIDFCALNTRFFRTKSRKRFLLEGLIMNSVEFYYDGRAAVITVTKKMMEETGCTENDMDDIAAIPGSIEGVICGITLRELSGEHDCKASVRTTKEIDANRICSVLGGGGHTMASGASPKGLTIHEIKQALLQAFAEQINEGVNP